MAIQMRRGLRADFDPTKMLPGEWAVAIDNDTANQIVWMCFAPGIVKRIGAYEDFYALIEAEYSEYIPDVICDVEQTGSATKPYTVGDYVITGGKMYVVTANIPDGGTFTPGTNVDQTTVGAVLKALSTGKQDTLTFDNVPTQGSNNPVKSGGIYTAIQASGKVDSVNNVQPDANKNVELNAEDIPADGIGDKTVTGNPIEVTDAIASVARDLDVSIEPIQDLHGYDKPWVGGAGKNLLVLSVDNIKSMNSGGSWNGNAYTYNGIIFTILLDSDGNIIGINANGTASADTSFYVGRSLSDGQSYKLNGSIGGSNSTYSIRVTGYGGAGDGDFTFTSSSANPVYIQVINGNTLSNKLFYPMVRLATETDSTFAPYTNICPISGMSEVNITREGIESADTESVTIQLGQTVYGGTLDVNTGVLTVDKIFFEYVGNETWVLNNTGTQNWYFEHPNSTARNSDVSENISNWLEYNGITASNTNIGIGVLSVGTVRVRLQSEVTVDTFKAMLASTPLQLCYKLATPTTVQLTAEQIELLEGYNYIFTDANSLELTYLGTEASNVQKEIDEFERVTNNLKASLAPIEESPAKAPHAVGDYIMFNNQFCKVTASISAEEQIIIGTNVRITTIADELLAIIAQISA